VPVVASDVGDLSKVIVAGTSGWLAPAGDVDAFTAAIRSWQALSPDDARSLRLSSWRHARDNFSEAAGLPQILEIYARLGVRPGA